MKINTNICTHHDISSSSYNLLNIPVYPSTLHHILYHNTPPHISPTSHVPSLYLVLLKSHPLHITYSFPLHALITSYRHHMFPRSSHITPSMHTSHPTDISHITSSSSNYTLLTSHVPPHTSHVPSSHHITSPWLFKSHTQHQGTHHIFHSSKRHTFLIIISFPPYYVIPLLNKHVVVFVPYSS